MLTRHDFLLNMHNARPDPLLVRTLSLFVLTALALINSAMRSLLGFSAL